MSPCSASANSKRPREMDAAALSQQRAGKRARQEEAAESSSSSSPAPAVAAGAMVPRVGTVLDVAPINIVQLPLQPPPAGREEPPCLSRHLLVALGLRADLPVHFIGQKDMTITDLDLQQNRFRIPSDGVNRRLRVILTQQELQEANLLPLPPPKKPRKRPTKEQQPEAAEPRNGSAEGEGEQPPPGKKIKQTGKEHGGLRVKLVDLVAGVKELQMVRWDSTQSAVIKGVGCNEFIRRCGFREKDAVEIWAFVQRRFHHFGVDMCDDSLLHVLIVNKDRQPRCRHCHVHAPHPGSHAGVLDGE